MIEWRKLPKGTYTYTHDGKRADVWQMGGPTYTWRYTVFHIDKARYLKAKGGFATLDQACEEALKAMGV